MPYIVVLNIPTIKIKMVYSIILNNFVVCTNSTYAKVLLYVLSTAAAESVPEFESPVRQITFILIFWHNKQVVTL